MDINEALALAREVRDGKVRSYVAAAQQLAAFVIDRYEAAPATIAPTGPGEVERLDAGPWCMCFETGSMKCVCGRPERPR